MRRVAVALLLVAASCARPQVVGNGCEWVDAPPRLHLCEPGQNPNVDANLIAECTALTRPMGDWLLGLTAQGRENCPGSGW